MLLSPKRSLLQIQRASVLIALRTPERAYSLAAITEAFGQCRAACRRSRGCCQLLPGGGLPFVQYQPLPVTLRTPHQST